MLLIWHTKQPPSERAMSKKLIDKILIANDLLSGEVMFMGQQGWILTHHKAKIAQTEEEQIALNELGLKSMANNQVVDAYLIDIALDEHNIPQPLHYRELMRTKGPSIRLDLGKQAENHTP
jgi:Protein of unknown function (DUF2849)